MTFYPQCRITRKDQDRLHSRLESLITSNAALVIATHYLVNGRAKFEPQDAASYVSERLPIELHLPIRGPLEDTLARRGSVDQLRLAFVEFDEEPLAFGAWASGLGKEHHIFGMVHLMANLLTPIFVEFYEAYKQALYDAHGSPDTWPGVWRFGRVIRNAMSHGNRISILGQKERPATWYGLTYAYTDNGREIFNVSKPDIMMADVIILMFEMDDVLHDLGCPI